MCVSEHVGRTDGCDAANRHATHDKSVAFNKIIGIDLDAINEQVSLYFNNDGT